MPDSKGICPVDDSLYLWNPCHRPKDFNLWGCQVYVLNPVLQSDHKVPHWQPPCTRQLGVFMMGQVQFLTLVVKFLWFKIAPPAASLTSTLSFWVINLAWFLRWRRRFICRCFGMIFFWRIVTLFQLKLLLLIHNLALSSPGWLVVSCYPESMEVCTYSSSFFTNKEALDSGSQNCSILILLLCQTQQKVNTCWHFPDWCGTWSLCVS